MVQGNLFIPVLPTYSNNLAGTASLSAQWFIGQGVSAFGDGRDSDNSWFDFSGTQCDLDQFIYDRKLMNQFGGYVQGQYWFTNQWFMNVAWGLISGLTASTAAPPASWPACRPPIRWATCTPATTTKSEVWQEL